MNLYAATGEAVALVGRLRQRCEVDVHGLLLEGGRLYPSASYAYTTGALEARLQTIDIELESLWGMLVEIERVLMPAEDCR